MMKTLLRNTLTVLNLIILGASLQAQTVIPVCPEANKTLMFNRPAGIGNNDFKWYKKESHDEDFKIVNGENSNTFGLDTRKTRPYEVFGLNLNDECNVVVTDTFLVVPAGRVLLNQVLGRVVPDDEYDAAVDVQLSPNILDTSMVVVKEEFRYLIDTNDPTSPDSLMISFPGYNMMRITDDTTKFVVPLEAFQLPTEENGVEKRIIDYEVYAVWNECDEKNVTINTEPHEYGETNIVADYKDEDYNLRYYVSGLVDILKGGEAPGNLIGIKNYDGDTLKNLNLILELNNEFNPLFATSGVVTTLDSLFIPPSSIYDLSKNTPRGDTILYPSNMMSGLYSLNLKAYKADNLDSVFSSSGEYLYENPNDFKPKMELSILDNYYMGEPTHKMNLNIITSPLSVYDFTRIEYYFLSEDKQDTSEVKTIPIPDLIPSDTIDLEIQLETGYINYQYDTVYMDFKAYQGFNISHHEFATGMIDKMLIPKNIFAYQSYRGSEYFRRHFIGDTIVSAGEFEGLPGFDELFSKDFRTVPEDTVRGTIYISKEATDIRFTLDLYAKLHNFYNKEIDETLKKNPFKLKGQIYAEYKYADTPGMNSIKSDALVINSFEIDTLADLTEQSYQKLKLTTEENGDSVYYFSAYLANNFSRYLDTARFYLSYSFDFEDNSLRPEEESLFIPNDIKFEIVPVRNDYLMIGPGLGVYPDSTYLWSDSQWNARNKRTTPEYGETYDLDLSVSGFRAENNLSIDDVEIGLYKPTALWDSLYSYFSKEAEFYLRDPYKIQKNYLLRFLNMNESGINSGKPNSGNLVFNEIYKDERFFTLERIDNLSEYITPNDIDKNGFVELDLPVKFDRDTRARLVVVDPNNKLHQMSETNMSWTYNYPYSKSGVDLTFGSKKVEGERESLGQFVYRGETFELHHAFEENYDLVDEEEVNTPEIADVFPLKKDEAVDFKINIKNMGISATTEPVGMILKLKSVGRNHLIQTTLDTVYIQDPILPIKDIENETSYFSYSFVPGEFLPENVSFDLHAEILYPNDPSFQRGTHVNNAEYSLSRFIISNPNLDIQVQTSNINSFECGSIFPIEVYITNKNDEQLASPLDIIFKDEFGYADTVTIEKVFGNKKYTAKFEPTLALDPGAPILAGASVLNYNYDIELKLTAFEDAPVVSSYERSLLLEPEFTLPKPVIYNFDGQEFHYAATDIDQSDLLYNYEITHENPSGDVVKKITGQTNSHRLDLNELGFGFSYAYGTYTAKVYVRRGDCEASEVSSYSFTRRIPYTPPNTDDGGSDGGGNNGGGDSPGDGGSDGGGNTGGGGSCYDNVTNSALVDSKFTENDGQLKLWIKFKNRQSRTVSFKVCIQRSNGTYDCGQGSLSPGSTSTWWNYDVMDDDPGPNYSTKYAIFFRDDDDYGCRFPNL